MNIAYITADRGIPLFGKKGASVHVRELVQALTALGQNVTIFAAARGVIPDPDAVDLAGMADIVLAENAKPSAAENGDGLHDKERRTLAVGQALRKQLVRRHAVEPFDFIYERYSLFSTAGVRAARALSIPCLVEVNAPLVLEQKKYRKLALTAQAEAVESEVFQQATAVLAVSREVRSYVLGKGASPARTHVVPNGVDVARFHPDVPPQCIPELSGRFVVGFTGSLKPWHGIETLLNAFRSLAERAPDYHLLIVGDGPLRHTIERFAEDAGLRDRVTITGWVPHEALPGLVKAMDVAVAPYPKLDDFYFSPLKVYEYMAVGVPIVASDLGQVAEVLDHGKTALLVQPGDAGDLAAGIESFRRDSVLRSSLGRAAAEVALNYTWEGNAQRILERAGNAQRSAGCRQEVA